MGDERGPGSGSRGKRDRARGQGAQGDRGPSADGRPGGGPAAWGHRTSRRAPRRRAPGGGGSHSRGELSGNTQDRGDPAVGEAAETHRHGSWEPEAVETAWATCHSIPLRNMPAGERGPPLPPSRGASWLRRKRGLGLRCSELLLHRPAPGIPHPPAHAPRIPPLTCLLTCLPACRLPTCQHLPARLPGNLPVLCREGNCCSGGPAPA